MDHRRHEGLARGGGLGVVIALGAVDLAVPQDRKGSFEPQIVRKG
jgi:transposase-like protein